MLLVAILASDKRLADRKLLRKDRQCEVDAEPTSTYS